MLREMHDHQNVLISRRFLTVNCITITELYNYNYKRRSRNVQLWKPKSNTTVSYWHYLWGLKFKSSMLIKALCNMLLCHFQFYCQQAPNESPCNRAWRTDEIDFPICIIIVIKWSMLFVKTVVATALRLAWSIFHCFEFRWMCFLSFSEKKIELFHLARYLFCLLIMKKHGIDN